MNTGKKKWAILLIIALVIGTGSYVFANPSLDSSKDTLNPNHSVNSESNQNKSDTNSNIDVVINQDELNIEDLENMNVPNEEAQILEQIIANNNTNASNDLAIGNIGNPITNNPNNGSNTNVGNDNNNDTGNNNNPGYVPPGNTGSSGNTGDNNTGSGNNTGGNGSETNPGDGSSTGSETDPGNTGDSNPDSGNTGEGDNNDNTNPGESLPSFVFEENGSFSTNTIVINDPNYDHMIVYNWNTGDRDVTSETEYTIKVDNAVYIFIVFDKEGNYQGFTMHHVKAE